ncbi:odorant receptor 17 [Nasonia vitripennis]|uniref:Odorant receptor n=1 Tax=Nasonia vitripennis TaxID=7425 RepID=A0A7M6UPJ2_NASVI|nr:odorant receptor 17 [Nasonia vitripennis]
MSDKEGFDVAIQTSRTILRFLGVWPDPKRKESWIYSGHFLIPAIVMFYFVNIPQTMMVTKVWGDLNAVLEVLTTSDIPIGIALFKMLGIWYNRDVLGQLVVSMSEDWKSVKSPEERDVMWRNARLSRLLSVTIIGLAEGTIVAQFAMVIYFNVLEARQYSLTKDNVTARFRPLYMSAQFFYDAQKSPNYEIHWLFQCSSTIFAASAFSSVDAFFAVLMLHLCGQLNNLREKLKKLPKQISDKGGGSFVEKLSEIVTRHDHLDRFGNAIEDAFNVMFLVQMVASSMVLCLQGYQLVMITTAGDGIPLFELIFMIYFTCCFTFSLFVYCYVAEVLRTESMEVGNAAYESNWYDLPSCETKLLMLVIIRAKKPFKITAGKFAAFSLGLYCSILRSSGGYLSMLLAMKDRLAS